jgi:hypothetical protein
MGNNDPSSSEIPLGQFKISGSSMLVSIWMTLGLAVALQQPRAFWFEGSAGRI